MAQNAKDIQMRELKDLLNELRETNKLLRNVLEETQKEKAVLKQERLMCVLPLNHPNQNYRKIKERRDVLQMRNVLKAFL